MYYEIYLVDGMSHVEIPIGIRGPIMQYEFGWFLWIILLPVDMAEHFLKEMSIESSWL